MKTLQVKIKGEAEPDLLVISNSNLAILVRGVIGS